MKKKTKGTSVLKCCILRVILTRPLDPFGGMYKMNKHTESIAKSNTGPPPASIIFKAKEKYRGVFEIQKSGDKTSSGEIGLDIRTHASPKVGQDQVSGGVSVLCWHAAPVAYVPWKPCTIGKKSNSVIRSRSVMVKNWFNVLSMEGVTVFGHHPECRVTFGRGGPHIVW